MIVSINQPAYLPWAGYFHRIALSDLHIVLDHVQFEKNSFTNRNRIRTRAGWCWLTVPVKTHGRFGALPIHEVQIANERRWARKHWDSLRFNYAHAAHFATHRDFFEDVYRRSWERLIDLLAHTNRYLSEALGIRRRWVFSSTMSPRAKGSDLVLELCREVGAKTYLSGPLGRNYLREHDFREAGIEVRYHDYRAAPESQASAASGLFLSVVDLLFHHGPRTLEVLESPSEGLTVGRHREASPKR